MRRIARRLLTTVTACVVTLILTAIALALVEMYLVGHGHAGLMRASTSLGGVQLSPGDFILLGFALLAAVLAWIRSGRRS